MADFTIILSLYTGKPGNLILIEEKKYNYAALLEAVENYEKMKASQERKSAKSV